MTEKPKTEAADLLSELVASEFWQQSKVAGAVGLDYQGPSGADVIDWLSDLIPRVETWLSRNTAARFDVGAFDEEGEVVALVKGVRLSDVDIVLLTLDREHNAYSYSWREHETD